MYAENKHWGLLRGFFIRTLCEADLQKEQFTMRVKSRYRKTVESGLDWVESHLL